MGKNLTFEFKAHKRMTQLTEAEKQIIACLTWFRTRYALFAGLDMNRKATQESIRDFGKIWIGTFLEDWGKSFDELESKGILKQKDGDYCFTEIGEALKTKLATEVPVFKYEYDYYFALEQNSKAHQQFCLEVYGADFSQHGLIDQLELQVLIEQLKHHQHANIIDIGCGNGRITEYLTGLVNSQFLGIDISAQAIQVAQERNQYSNLAFEAGNMNSLTSNQRFDAILFLDTIYYAANIQTTLRDCVDMLTENGVIYMYYSEFIMGQEELEYLAGANTRLAKILKELGLQFEFTNLTESGIRHWKKKLNTLESMKHEFEDEGNLALWDYRYREANRYAHWGDDKYARYFYEIRKD